MENNAPHQVLVKLNAEKPRCRHSSLVCRNQSSNMKPVCRGPERPQFLLRNHLHFYLCTCLGEFGHCDYSVSSLKAWGKWVMMSLESAPKKK